tara:strand:+ start:977 stop:2374 length:1398 start_codon:yes stop_codon:yes gene_type:complete
MAYIINKTDGSAVTTITDGTIDNTTSLTLFGKSYSGFGELLNENLVKLLENSAGTSAPAAPLTGELYFDTSTAQLKVYDGANFKPTGGAKSQSSQPTSASAGDLWMDSDDDQLYVYTGSAWQLVGPQFTKGQGLSGWQVETIQDNGGVNKTVASMYVGTTRVAILSKETFTPGSAQSGFASIKSGITLNSTLGAVFEGSTASAAAIDVSGTTNTSASVIAGGNFLRSDAADTTTGQLTVDVDAGVRIGDQQELVISVSSNDVTVAQTKQDKDLKFTVNDGGSTKTPIQLVGATGGISLTGDVTITGNLNVSGEYENTSGEINLLNDQFLKLGNGSPNNDGGIIVETSDTDDARLFWDESASQWVAGFGASYSQIIRDTDAVTDGNANKEKVLKTTAAGLLTITNINLAAVGSAITTSDTSSVAVPTVGQVATYGNLWGGSAKYVNTSAPTSGDGNNGDFWFVREA